jgi:hypothetical protein
MKMKKMWFLLLALPMMMAACGDKNDEINEEFLVGTWEITGVEAVVDAPGADQEFLDDLINGGLAEEFGMDNMEGDEIEFRADGVFVADGDAIGTYEISGKTLIITQNFDEEETEEPLVLKFRIDGLSKSNIKLYLDAFVFFEENDADVDLPGMGFKKCGMMLSGVKK